MKEKLSIFMITHRTRVSSGPRSRALAAQLVKRGHDVSLLLISGSKRFGMHEYTWEGVRIMESPDLLWGRLRSGWDPWNMLNRFVYLGSNEEQYDLIHCFETRPCTIYPALFLSRKKNLPIITDWNDWWGHHGLIDVNRPFLYKYLAGWLETYYEEAFRVKTAGLTVIAKGLEERAIGLGVPAENICLIPGGASINYFKLTNKEECRRNSKLPLTAPILGFCSADSYLDIEMVLDSLVLVAKKYSDVKLIITGMVKRKVTDLVEKLGLSQNVIFPGFLPFSDYSMVLGSADVFLLPMADKPYNRGRWPNKMGDYLSMARPTVANPVGDIKTLFEKYPVGRLAQWDPVDFSNQIIYLLDHPAESSELGKTGRWVAENVYNWDALGEKLEAFYLKTLRNRSVDVSQPKRAWFFSR